MSTPNPLIPQGTFQAQASKGASNVRIAVATIVAIHVVFFGGLLLQGCKRDTKTAGNNTDTTASTTSSNLSLPPITSDSLYYSNSTHLPTEAPPGTPLTGTQSVSTASENTLAPGTTNSTRDPWKPNNLGGIPTYDATPGSAGTGATKEYTVARGDSFAKIAKANGTTVAAIRKANPNVDPAKVRAGTKLQVPTGTVAASSTAASAATGISEANGSAPSGDTYTVKAGDTLTKVSKAHNITVSQLRAANNLKTSGLKVGQKLKIPAPSAATGTNDATVPTVKHSIKTSKPGTNTTHTAAH